MSKHEIFKHLLLVHEKLGTTINARGVLEFLPNSTSGFIQHCSSENPQRLVIRMWSRHGRISQTLVLDIADETAREDIATCIASSFEYKVDAVPDCQSLTGMVVKAVSRFNEARPEVHTDAVE